MPRRSSRVIESQLKQIDSMFRAQSEGPQVITLVDVKKDKKCDIHGDSRRCSVDFSKPTISRKGSMLSNGDGKRSSYCSTESLNMNNRKKNRNSIASITELVQRSATPSGLSRDSMEREIHNHPRRESMPIIEQSKTSATKKNSLDTWNSKLFKGMEHPANFPSMLRSSAAPTVKNGEMGRRASSSWNVNHFHNYNNVTNLDKKQSLSTSDKLFKRDYDANGSKSNGSTGSSPEPKKELHSILKHKRSTEEDLKEIMKRLSFDYIEREMSQNGNKMDSDVLSNSDSSSGGNGRRTPLTFAKLAPRRISVDSLDSRRSSRRFSDFSINGDEDIDDDAVMLRNRLNKSSAAQVSLYAFMKLRI